MRVIFTRSLLILVIGCLPGLFPDRCVSQEKVSSCIVRATSPSASPGKLSARASRPFFAYSIYQVLGNKTRMIQVATVFMIIGIMFLMWGKTK